MVIFSKKMHAKATCHHTSTGRNSYASKTWLDTALADMTIHGYRSGLANAALSRRYWADQRNGVEMQRFIQICNSTLTRTRRFAPPSPLKGGEGKQAESFPFVSPLPWRERAECEAFRVRGKSQRKQSVMRWLTHECLLRRCIS